MPRRRKNKDAEILLRAAWDFSTSSWRIGAVITSVLAVLCLFAFFFAWNLADTATAANAKTIQLPDVLIWVYFLPSGVLYIAACVFGMRTYSAYHSERNF